MQDYTGMFEKVAGRSKYHMAVKAENAIFNGVRNGRVAPMKNTFDSLRSILKEKANG